MTDHPFVPLEFVEAVPVSRSPASWPSSSTVTEAPETGLPQSSVTPTVTIRQFGPLEGVLQESDVSRDSAGVQVPPPLKPGL